MTTLSKLTHNEYAKLIVPIVLVVGLVVGFFFGLQLFLGNSNPIRVVESGSMCIPYGRYCNDWLSLNHPFEPTLHKGDLIIIQHVNPDELNTNYPNSDIIVYHDPTADLSKTPIVHRIVASYTDNGAIYFQTKGDGNPGEFWPNSVPASDYDSNAPGIWAVSTGKGVPADLVEGKVILRIPYLGWITLIMKDNSWVTIVIISIVLLLLALEIVLPLIKRKAKPSETDSPSQIT